MTAAEKKAKAEDRRDKKLVEKFKKDLGNLSKAARRILVKDPFVCDTSLAPPSIQ